ncbi:hypothetical protein CCOS2040_29740 [Streptomyces albidoflavus]|nr:hypothetical protein CCOS2040_29740 [Streptomyces albidoflavus]
MVAGGVGHGDVEPGHLAEGAVGDQGDEDDPLDPVGKGGQVDVEGLGGASAGDGTALVADRAAGDGAVAADHAVGCHAAVLRDQEGGGPGVGHPRAVPPVQPETDRRLRDRCVGPLGHHPCHAALPVRRCVV